MFQDDSGRTLLGLQKQTILLTRIFMRVVAYVIFFALILTLAVGAAEERYPVGHPDQGLPHPDAVLTPYHEDPNHVLNRIFRTSFLVTTIPAEVGLAIPREHRDPSEFFRTSWYFAVRPGHRQIRNSLEATHVSCREMGSLLARQRPWLRLSRGWMRKWFGLSRGALSLPSCSSTICCGWPRD